MTTIVRDIRGLLDVRETDAALARIPVELPYPVPRRTADIIGMVALTPP